MEVKVLQVGPIGTNCYILEDEKARAAAIIDPGDEAGRILPVIEDDGVDVKYILLTHGHFDHIMAAEELKKEWGIKICACEKELEVLRDSKKNLMMDYYRKDYTLEPDLTVCDGETFEAAGVTWKVIETPGHTIGSCCYYIESEDLLFAGDTLFRTSYGRVDLPTGDAMSMLASVKKLLTLPETVKVYPGHMGVTSIEYEKKHNPLARY